jgi:hypothetical protein
MLDDFYVPEINVPKYKVDLEIDKNLQKFISYKGLIKDKSLLFDNQKNYQELVEQIIENYFLEMKSYYQELTSYFHYNPRINLDDLQEKHFFSSGFCDGQSLEEDVEFIKYLLTLIDYSDYTENPSVIFSLNNEVIRRSEFSGKKIKEAYLPFEEFTTEDAANAINFYYLTAGYRIKLKDFKSSFSHVDINLGLSFYDKKIYDEYHSINIDKNVFIWTGRPSEFIWMFRGKINNVSWEIKDFLAFSADAYIPVFYISRKLFFEIGLNYRYINAEYTIYVDREIYEQSSIDPSILGPEVETFIMNTENHLLGGSIGVGYSIINPLSIKGIISTLPSFQVSLAYLFAL